MKVVYVAGKYSAPNEYGVKKNIAAAEEFAVQIWQAGGAAICPHLNTAHWTNLLSHEQFLKGDCEMIKRCDAVFMCPGYQDSKGAMIELKFARDHGVHVFYSIGACLAFVMGGAE